MSQDRMMQPESTTPRVNPQSLQAPDITATITAASSLASKVRVVHGSNEQYFDSLSGKTVGTVRKSLREVFNIPGDADALVSGKQVGDDFILEGGMQLEFVKEHGVKGDLGGVQDEQPDFLMGLTHDEYQEYERLLAERMTDPHPNEEREARIKELFAKR